MRSITSVTALAAAATLMTTSISWAGSTGRRNTALATTALAVGAWSNGTGKAGRKNTAILATAGAAVAWSRYSAKKKQEKHRARYARVAARPEPPAWVNERYHRRDHWEPPGRHLGWYKNGKHRGHHHNGDDD